jgi:hypothetical protein
MIRTKLKIQVAALILLLAAIPLPAVSAENAEDLNILAEIWIAREYKDREEEVKKKLEDLSIKRVRIQFVRLGNPPQNVGIGRNVPVEVAQGTMRLALEYNQGIQFLIPESLFSHAYVAFGTSAFDEASQIPVKKEDIDRLLDPALTAAEFHEFYRSLTEGKARSPLLY